MSRMTSRTITSSYLMRKRRTSPPIDHFLGKSSDRFLDEETSTASSSTPKRTSDRTVSGTSRKSSKDFGRRWTDASPNSSQRRSPRIINYQAIRSLDHSKECESQVTWNYNSPTHSDHDTRASLRNSTPKDFSAIINQLLPENNSEGFCPRLLSVWQTLDKKNKISATPSELGANSKTMAPSKFPSKRRDGAEEVLPHSIHQMLTEFENSSENSLDEVATTSRSTVAVSTLTPVKSPPARQVSVTSNLFSDDVWGNNDDDFFDELVIPETQEVTSQLPAGTPALHDDKSNKFPASTSTASPKTLPTTTSQWLTSRSPPPTGRITQSGEIAGAPPTGGAAKPVSLFQSGRGTSGTLPTASTAAKPHSVTSQQSSSSGPSGVNRSVASATPRPSVEKPQLVTSQQSGTGAYGIARPGAMLDLKLSVVSTGQSDKQFPGATPPAASGHKPNTVTLQKPGTVAYGVVRPSATVAPKLPAFPGNQPNRRFPETLTLVTSGQKPSQQFGAPRSVAASAVSTLSRQLDKPNTENRETQPAVSHVTANSQPSLINPPIDGSTLTGVLKKRFLFKPTAKTQSPPAMKTVTPPARSQLGPDHSGDPSFPPLVATAATADDSTTWDDIDDSVFQLMLGQEASTSDAASSEPVNSDGTNPPGGTTARGDQAVDTDADFWADDDFDSVFMELEMPGEVKPASSLSSSESVLSNGEQGRPAITLVGLGRVAPNVSATTNASAQPPATMRTNVGLKKRPASGDDWTDPPRPPGLLAVQPSARSTDVRSQLVGPAAPLCRPAQCSPEEIERKRRLAMEKRQKTMHQSQANRKH